MPLFRMNSVENIDLTKYRIGKTVINTTTILKWGTHGEIGRFNSTNTVNFNNASASGTTSPTAVGPWNNPSALAYPVDGIVSYVSASITWTNPSRAIGENEDFYTQFYVFKDGQWVECEQNEYDEWTFDGWNDANPADPIVE